VDLELLDRLCRLGLKRAEARVLLLQRLLLPCCGTVSLARRTSKGSPCLGLGELQLGGVLVANAGQLLGSVRAQLCHCSLELFCKMASILELFCLLSTGVLRLLQGHCECANVLSIVAKVLEDLFRLLVLARNGLELGNDLRSLLVEVTDCADQLLPSRSLKRELGGAGRRSRSSSR